MTLPDDIELDNKILDLLEPHYENIGFTREHAKTSVTFRKFQELIAIYRKKWETEADRKTLEAIYAILNGDDNQVDTAKTYIWNKLQSMENK